MACTNPKTAWPYSITKNLKQRYVFTKPKNFQGDTIEVPCGKCISCQMDRAKEWATRAVHEAQTNKHNCFITLTYSNENLPKNGSLVPGHLKQFIKNIRKSLIEQNVKIKYLAAGEYGSEQNTHRPHYHICLFGWDPPDKIYLFTNKQGDPVYTSEQISKRWGNKGFITVGALTYKSAAYTARYTLKKIENPETKNKQAKEIIDTTTGETNYDPVLWKIKEKMKGKEPEFIRMSKGIGSEWHKKYKTDTYKDYIHVNRAKHKIPRYYDKQLEKQEPVRYEKIKIERTKKAKEIKTRPNQPTNEQRNTVKLIKLKLLKRKI